MYVSDKKSSISEVGIAVVDPGFPLRGTSTYDVAKIFQKNCMKLKEFGPPGGVEHVPSAHPS